MPSPVPNLDVAPSRIALAKLEAQARRGDRRALPPEGPARRSWRDRYEFVVIDTPPALGLITVNALVAATHLLIPVQSSYFALEGTDDLLETVEKIRSRPNPEPQAAGRGHHAPRQAHDARRATSRRRSREVFGDRVFQTTISKSIRLEESPAHKESIFTFAPQSTGAYEYYRLCEEVIERV